MTLKVSRGSWHLLGGWEGRRDHAGVHSNCHRVRLVSETTRHVTRGTAGVKGNMDQGAAVCHVSKEYGMHQGGYGM